MAQSIHDMPLGSTPVAILDFETTGLSPKTGARVVEIAVVKVLPGKGAHLVLDTLVDPQGPVHASRIHGIYDDDVIGAPYFADVAPKLVQELSGCVVMAYNASFDMSFLEAELAYAARRAASPVQVPYACLMYMRPALGVGKRVGLHDACSAARLAIPDHRAAHDALAGAALWQYLRSFASDAGLQTFGDIAARKEYKFMESWALDCIAADAAQAVATTARAVPFKPRLAPIMYPDHGDVSARTSTSEADSQARERARGRAPRLASYLQALVDAFADAAVTEAEIHELVAIRTAMDLTPGEMRSVHADFYASALKASIADGFVSHQESANIAQLAEALRRVGWAPGDLSSPS